MKEEGYNIRDQRLPHFMTFTVVDWVDVFSRKNYRDLILESFDYCRKEKGIILNAYVIMSNHIHVVMGSKNERLSDLVRDFKKFTAKNCINLIKTEPESRKDWMLKRFEFAARSHSRNDTHQFWKYGSHSEEIFTENFMWTKLEYIHLNPVRAGIVEKASDYLYSSARNYVGKKGLIDIDLVEPKFLMQLKSQTLGVLCDLFALRSLKLRRCVPPSPDGNS
ncbi:MULTISPECIES: REP-associated tyrosine transposase [Emticicia]|uniref:REP-associated tyrosine transposase n=1 Tax=Emticicia TaxID=312278 RepID=UPI0007D8BEE5|nr:MULTISPECIES: transposase [Emticicia]